MAVSGVKLTATNDLSQTSRTWSVTQVCVCLYVSYGMVMWIGNGVGCRFWHVDERWTRQNGKFVDRAEVDEEENTFLYEKEKNVRRDRMDGTILLVDVHSKMCNTETQRTTWENYSNIICSVLDTLQTTQLVHHSPASANATYRWSIRRHRLSKLYLTTYTAHTHPPQTHTKIYFIFLCVKNVFIVVGVNTTGACVAYVPLNISQNTFDALYSKYDKKQFSRFIVCAFPPGRCVRGRNISQSVTDTIAAIIIREWRGGRTRGRGTKRWCVLLLLFHINGPTAKCDGF